MLLVRKWDIRAIGDRKQQKLSRTGPCKGIKKSGRDGRRLEFLTVCLWGQDLWNWGQLLRPDRPQSQKEVHHRAHGDRRHQRCVGGKGGQVLSSFDQKSRGLHLGCAQSNWVVSGCWHQRHYFRYRGGRTLSILLNKRGWDLFLQISTLEIVDTGNKAAGNLPAHEDHPWFFSGR